MIINYLKSEIIRQEKRFVLIKSNELDGQYLRQLIQKHDPENSNVIIVKKDSNGLLAFHGIGEFRVNSFSPQEDLSFLTWIPDSIEL